MDAIVYVVRTKDGAIEPVGVRPISYSSAALIEDDLGEMQFTGIVAGVSRDSCGMVSSQKINYLDDSKFKFNYIDEEGWTYWGTVMLVCVDFMYEVDKL